MAEMIYIPIGKLRPHPDNPRKDLGDVSELADSIKANGILQNLTVVKKYGEITGDFTGNYTVIIGHRRLAAAKLAGLKELPCVVAEMTQREQLQTMLMENMQRSDLTVYEQAQGFQMMLDLGASVDEIAAESGFSSSTVRRRVKLLELDKDKFKASETRGATLQDYMELDKIHDPETKNKVLDSIGTPNFHNELRKAQEQEERLEFVAARAAEVSQWATELRDVDFSEYAYFTAYNWWNKTLGAVRPTDADVVDYYYRVGRDGVSLFKRKEDEQETEEDRKNREMREQDKRTGVALQQIEGRCAEMQMAFVKGFGQAKQHANEICEFACTAMCGAANYYAYVADPDVVAELLEIDIDDETPANEVAEAIASCPKSPLYKLLAVAYAAYEGRNLSYYQHDWNGSFWEYVPRKNQKADILYDFLTSLGYEVSDEEQALRDGTHELFFNGEAV